jgi:putative ABC transport system ATP-binding protein
LPPPLRRPGGAATLPGVISLQALTQSFGGPAPRTLFAGLSLEIARGEYLAIVGESGVGKSTLLNLIAGLDRPADGRVLIDGIDLATLDDDGLTRLRRTRMGFVFQAFHVLPYLDVAHNVALPLALAGVRNAERDGRVTAMLERVGLAGRGASRPAELSGGELQRVALARALVHGPAILLADEPTGNLDADTAAQIIALLHDTLRASGATGVLVTHSRAAAASADRVVQLTREGLRPVSADGSA